MKAIGPDHPITVESCAARTRVMFQGHVIADSADCLTLREATYRPVVYFPKSDVAMEFLARSAHHTHCPYKGDASYFTLNMDGHIAENAVWSYEDPFDQMSPIRGRLAFYPDKVEIYETAADSEAAIRRDDQIREAILHTDSGSGSSQAEHWPATRGNPTNN